MHLRPFPFLFSVLLLLAISRAFPLSAASIPSDGASRERTEAAFLLAFGRLPSPAEAAQRATGATDDATLTGRLEQHRQHLTGNPAAQRSAVAQACLDAFGREATSEEITAWSAGHPTYTELMQRHVRALATHPEDYRQVIERAYQFAAKRAPHSIELDYWKSFEALPFMLLSACIENWATRNQPGLMFTTGVPSITVNSPHLTTLRLSPAIAREARAAIGLDGGTDSLAREALGLTVVAHGAREVVSVGGIHLVVTGRRLAPSR
jgi:hypothetical protein